MNLVGDLTLQLFSSAPGAQGDLERWSLVFFSRPGNSVVLRALVEDSPMIAEAVKKTPEKNYETGSTSYDWFTRRIKNQRLLNRKASTSVMFGLQTVDSDDYRARKHGWLVEGLKLLKPIDTSACSPSESTPRAMGVVSFWGLSLDLVLVSYFVFCYLWGCKSYLCIIVYYFYRGSSFYVILAATHG